MEHAKPLLIFAAVLKHGSMNAAAPHLGITASAVSQHIHKLEKIYKIRLLNRSTRNLSPTEAGRKLWGYAERLQTLLDECDTAMNALQAEPQGSVAISLPSGYTALPQIRQLIETVRANHPKIRLNFCSADSMSDLLHEHIDIALRTTTPDNPDFIARELAVWPMTLCATPAYLAENPVNHAAELLNRHWLNFNDNILRNMLDALGLPPDLPENHIDCSVSDARELVLAGLGIGIFLSGDSSALIGAGKLAEILPNQSKPVRTLYAVTAQRSDSAKVAAVLAELKAAFGKG